MAEKEVPFWEEAYQNLDHITFSNQPNGTVKEFEKLLPKEAKILEAGCGEGQKVLYLAKQGYQNIDAFDLSENGILKLKKLCGIHSVELHAFVDDLTTYRFDKTYEIKLAYLIQKIGTEYRRNCRNKGILAFVRSSSCYGENFWTILYSMTISL